MPLRRIRVRSSRCTVRRGVALAEDDPSSPLPKVRHAVVCAGRVFNKIGRDGQDALCTCLQCSYMRFTTANTKAVDQPISKIPVRPSIPASTRQPGPTTTSPNPIVV